MKIFVPIAFLAIILCLSIPASAQNYSNGIGLRFGYNSGISFKHFRNETSAYEIILGIRSFNTNITMLWEHHESFEVSRLQWYYGIGGHIALYSFPGCQNWVWNGYRYKIDSGSMECFNSGIGVGFDGILGIEYLFDEFPFTVGADIKPIIEVSTFRPIPIIAIDFAITVRFVFENLK